MSNNPKSLTETINTPAGTFLPSVGFQAVVGQCKTIQTRSNPPKTFYKAEVSEGGAKASITSFTVDFAPLSGKLVKFIGMGLKMGEPYNGTPQITIGDKARIIPVGEAPAEQQQAPQAASSTPSVQNKAINGETVGMALKAAIDIAIANGDTSMGAIWATASDIIRLSKRIQAGELHEVKTLGAPTYPIPPQGEQSNDDIPF
jgi:hypothetical protein